VIPVNHLDGPASSIFQAVSTANFCFATTAFVVLSRASSS
jgi:hypothetical protein